MNVSRGGLLPLLDTENSNSGSLYSASNYHTGGHDLQASYSWDSWWPYVSASEKGNWLQTVKFLLTSKVEVMRANLSKLTNFGQKWPYQSWPIWCKLFSVALAVKIDWYKSWPFWCKLFPVGLTVKIDCCQSKLTTAKLGLAAIQSNLTDL